MTQTDPLTQGREAYERRRWSDAVDALSAADADGPLDPEDLERLATATSHRPDREGRTDIRTPVS